MMDVNQYSARDMWNALPAAERTKILEALKADLILLANDYAGLPPELHAGIAAGMPGGGGGTGGPPTPRPPGDDEAETEATETHGRRKR